MPKVLTQTVRFHVCMDAGLAERLSRVVGCEGRTASEVIRSAVRTYVREHGQVELPCSPIEQARPSARGTPHARKRSASEGGALVLSVSMDDSSEE